MKNYLLSLNTNLPAPLQSETILPLYTEVLVVSIEGLQNASTLPLSHA